jgi:hypothetical protein
VTVSRIALRRIALQATAVFAVAGAASVSAQERPDSAASAAIQDSVPSPAIRFELPHDTLHLRTPLSLQPGGRFGLRVPASIVGARWEQETRARLAAARLARGRWPTAPRFAEAEVPRAPPAPPPFVTRRQGAEALAPGEDALSRFADLGLQLHATFKMTGEQFRNHRCTAADLANPLSGCQGGFPTPALDAQFTVRAGGVVGDRVHINLDYDSENEFTANNNISVYYQGLEDEILQRIEVGNVSFNAPASRFMTAAVPANSFGIQAEGQLGAFEWRGIAAQQKGSQLQTKVFTVGQTTTEPVDREVRDLDYESGRFFFTVNPQLLPGFPDVDPLAVAGELLPAQQRPVQMRVYRLRAQSAQNPTNPNLGGILAVAVRNDSPQRVGPFQWELLVEGRDYYLDPSGLWFALSTRVGDQDFLAVSYITAAGDTVGTFPSINGGTDTLRLIYEPRKGPEVPTFFHEMRNVYRIGGSDVDRSSLEISLAVNESEQPLQGGGTYLSRLRIALSNDESTVDQYNRVFPRDRDPNGGAPIKDLFLIFPHLQPFADSVRLQPAERNDSLYRTPYYLLNSQGPPPRFRIRMHYQAAGGGDRGSLSLGAPQIREGSEKLFLGNTQLTRGRDYEIDYAVGQVTFLNADSLFPGGATQVRAQFEENQSYDVAPQSLLGFSTTYSLGSRGRISAILLTQQETSLLTRPQLGFEPQSNFLSGLSGEFAFRPDGITRALDALPLISTSVPSNLSISGEIATSRPNPNRAGQAYIEEFEGGSFRSISLNETQWQLGSRPSSGRGLSPPYLDPSGGFADLDAVPLVWQSSVQSGNDLLQFTPQDIDSTIILTGTARQIENVMWLSLKPDTIGGAPNPLTGAPRWFRPHTPGPRWRSISQPLGGSGLGVDLSRVEYLEFWVLEDAEQRAREAGTEVLFDFGTVFEDAVAFGPDTLRVVNGDTVFSGFQFLGTGRLDTERDTLTNVFNASVGDLGILGDRLPSVIDGATGETLTDFPMCEQLSGGGLPAFPLGDLGARCTRHNGFPDTEDLDGDGRLDVTVGRVQEDVFRFVFKVGDERYFVRDGNTLLDGQGRPLTWRLYRIPFREDTLQIGTPSIRQVQSMRITVVAPDQGLSEQEVFFAVARMRLEGAPWLKRASTPIAGLSGAVGQPHGEVIVSTVSTENRDLAYTSPPGVTDEASQQGAGLTFTSQQINEKSLRVLARDLRPGERAEAFLRFTDEADKNLLRYGSLRVWARGRGPGWEDGDLEFYLKAGRDENNFYMYRTPVRSVDWLPEVVIDLKPWLLLRAQLEAAWLRGEPPSGAATCGGDSTAYVACDGPYFVQVRDPGIAPPNLARVSEMAVGILRTRQSVYIDEAELWVDDIRLDNVVADMGIAGAVDVHLQAADVADLSFGYQNRDARFQQLGEDPTFSTDGMLRFGSTLRLDKLFPGGGFSIPFGFQTVRTSSNPLYLNRSDILADALPDLRRPRSTLNTFSIGYRKIKRGQSLLERVVLDPFSLQASASSGTATTSLSTQSTSNRQARFDYNNVPQAATVQGAPSFLIKLVDAMPGFIRNSEFARSLRTSRLRVNPAQVRGALNLVDNQSTRYAYRVPVILESDTALQALTSVAQSLRGDATLDLRPFQTLTFRTDVSTTRDLQDYGDSTTIARLLRARRQRFLGLGVGFERQRSFSTGINLTPAFASWLRPRFAFTSAFTLNRDPNQPLPVREIGDTAGAFRTPETIGNSRRRELGATFAPARLVGGVFGDSSFVTKVFRGLEPIDVSYSRELRSSFDRVPFDPSFGFQLGLGSVDEFRTRNGVPATSAGQLTARNAAGSVRFPLGLMMRLSYQDQETFNWSLRAGQDEQAEVVSRSQQWPVASVAWTWSPRGKLRRLFSIFNTSAQYAESNTENVQAGLAGGQGSRSETQGRTLAPAVTVTWGGGIITSLQYRQTRTDGLTSGNINRREQDEWNATLNFAFRTPIVKLANQIRTTANYTRSIDRVCLIQAGTDECVPVSEGYRRVIDIRMDTGITPQVRGGATFSYVLNAQRQISQERSQMVFSIFAEIFLVSGQLR